MIGIGGTLFSQEKIWDTEFAVRVSRDIETILAGRKIRLFFNDMI